MMLLIYLDGIILPYFPAKIPNQVLIIFPSNVIVKKKGLASPLWERGGEEKYEK